VNIGEPMKRLIEYITTALGMLAFAFFFTWLVINWITGCGEVFYTGPNSYVHGECVLHPFQ